ncbi:MAG TPA: MG2 domain-containing protein, partial [Planctomycetota bacterium]|nr:MG2 domain-containing protein [Planctomycetota bacterium]
DGKKVIAEGVTATDGVWRWQGKELQNLDDLRVFAVDASGSGASSLNLSGMGFAPGLLAKGFLFTDRPLYQPGQRVNLKGIIREVKDGLYRLPATDDYRVQVWSAGGRLLLQREVKFTSFGTFAGELDLPADAELGDWRIAVGRTGHDELVFTGGFAVARYERPRLSLKIDLQQPVVFRGEKIQGKVVVNHFYGEPAVGKDVVLTMALPDGQQIERQAATNAAGEVVIDFDTTEFAEEAMAMITARLPADNVGTRTVVPVVTSEFAPTAKTVRKVYLAGEPFEVEVGIQDRSGRPLAREATAVLLRLEQHQVNNNPSVAVRLDDVEVEVERKPVKTGADGIGRVTFSSKKGGQYRVRIEAKDRFGNVVSGDAMLTVSGDDDKVKLRLLCDRESFRVGEAAAVKIVNRAGARLALLCWQGDGILAYETRVLPVGESELQLPLLPQHAPNFALAVAMVDGNKFHQAEREFRVLRDLRVTVKAPLTARPGAEVELAVEAQDPQGKPVQAEVAVAMVDEALLALHGDTTPAISQFFFGQLRETGFRTVTSCTWAYDGPSKPVSGALLAEDERRRLEEAAKLPAAGAPLAAEVLDHALLQQLEKGESEDKAGRPAGSAGVLTGGKVLDRDAGRTKNGRAVPGSPAARRAAANEPAKSGKEADSDEMALGAVRMFTDNVDAEQPTYFGYVKLATGGWQTKQGQDLNALMFGDLSDIHMGTPLDRAFAAESNQPRTNFSESGAWLSALTTDSNGRGSAKVTLPHSTTGWLLKARAVTADTYVGEGEAKLRTTQELQVDLIGPPALVEGDETQLQIHAHNLTDQAQDVHARWTSKGGFDGKGELTLHLGPHQEGEQSQLVRATGAEPVELGVDGSAGAFTDKLQRTLLVQPFGIEFRDGRAGSTKEREVFELSLPQGREFTALQLLVELGPDPGRDLLSAALGLGYMPTSCRQVEMTTLARASRGLAALLALDYLEQAGSGKKADQSRLLGQAQAVLTTLLSAQLPDGSFAWAGKRTVDVRSTCQALRFFAACRHRGLAAAEAPANKAGEWLLQFLRTAGNEQRPDVLWALASVERARFESLNSIHRVRTGLALDSLARLALAWHESKRPELAAEALDVLRQKLTAATMKQQQLEAVALAARALLQHDKRDALGTAAVEFLRHARMGVSWGTPEATAAAIAVLAMAQGSGAGTGRSAEFKVLVNGHELATTPKEATGMNMVFSVPAGWLQQRGNKVEVTVSGGAEVHYAANLIGFARGFKVEDKNDQLVHVERKYLADVLRQDNKEVPQGFSIVQGNNIRTFENKITQLRQGETARARLGFWIRHETDQKTMTPLVVEEPLPAGCSVPRDSIHGNFEDVDVQPDRLLFYYREGVTSDWISYDLQARFPGNYRVLPARVYGALRPELLAYSDTGSLRVNARSAAEHDDYTLTPDELYHLGKNAFDAGALLSGELRAQRLQQSWQHLDKLLADWHKKDFYLRDDVFKEVARMMLFLGIERNDSKAIVRFFEELKDRYADLVIPFDKILAVGKAYLDLGEFEAALLVFRATADASFLKEANVATTLENLGEIKASTQFLERLLLAYPDLNTMRASRYGIGQKLAELAARIDPTAPVDDKIGSVAQLRARALAAFREFLICYPEDPLAEEVSFAWATTQVEGKDLKAALLVAEAALQRYPQSPFTDEFLYTAGYAQFVLGNHDAAFAALKRVAEEEFPNDKGGKGPSESKWHAVYLQGQIHHARGEPALALAAYQKVEDRFSDAGEAADYFLRKQLALPEVSSFAL